MRKSQARRGAVITGHLLLPSAEGARREAEARKAGLPKFARVAFLVVFAYLIVGFALQEIEVLGLTRQVRELEAEAAGLATENARLVEEIKYVQTDTYIEQVAREELGLIWPNEIPYAPGGRTTGDEGTGGGTGASGTGGSTGGP